MFVGIGVGIGRQRFLGNFIDSYSARVLADGGTIEALTCVANASTLLQQASLLFIPSGYKAGVAYSALPNNGDGDLTWTRNSNASKYKIDNSITSLNTNLISWSEDFSNTLWIKTNSTITSNVVNAPNGALTADRLTDNSVNSIHSVSFLGIGGIGIYSFSCFAKADTLTRVGFWTNCAVNSTLCNTPQVFDLSNGTVVNTLSGVNASIVSVGNGWYRCQITIFSSRVGEYFISTVSSGAVGEYIGTGKSLFIWGAQLELNNSITKYIPTTGSIRSSLSNSIEYNDLNVPRLDYFYGNCPCLLLEPQRTNLVIYSSDYSIGGWTLLDSGGGVTRTSGSTVSFLDPYGSYKANGLSPRSDRTNYYAYNSGISYTSGSIYTISVFFKQGQGVSGRYVQITFPSDKFAQLGFANFDLQMGIVSLVDGISPDANRKATIEQYPNGWYRCILTCTATATGVSDGLAIWLANSGTSTRNPSFVGNTSDIVYSWGAQLEGGAYATTYIPTNGTAATRLADTFTRNNIYTNGLISASGGTWFVELKNNVAYTRDNAGGLEIQNSGGTSRIIIYNLGGNSRLSIFITGNGAIYTTTTENVKIAIKWNGTIADVFVNGTKVASNLPYTTTLLQNLLCNTGVPYFIQTMALYNTPLSDANCITLTT